MNLGGEHAAWVPDPYATMGRLGMVRFSESTFRLLARIPVEMSAPTTSTVLISLPELTIRIEDLDDEARFEIWCQGAIIEGTDRTPDRAVRAALRCSTRVEVWNALLGELDEPLPTIIG